MTPVFPPLPWRIRDSGLNNGDHQDGLSVPFRAVSVPVVRLYCSHGKHVFPSHRYGRNTKKACKPVEDSLADFLTLDEYQQEMLLCTSSDVTESLGLSCYAGRCTTTLSHWQFEQVGRQRRAALQRSPDKSLKHHRPDSVTTCCFWIFLPE
jgi:hypothetical protein